jgi:uncharacterized membrane protein
MCFLPTESDRGAVSVLRPSVLCFLGSHWRCLGRGRPSKLEIWMNFDRKYLVCSLSFAALGLVLGIFMAATNDHSELVAHAHILLIGFVLSFIYGIIHKLWLTHPNRAVANFQFVLHQLSAITISAGLFLLYGNMVDGSKVEPILGTASVGVLLGMLLMIYMVIKFGDKKSAA